MTKMDYQQKQRQIYKQMEEIIEKTKKMKKESFELKKEIKNKIDESKTETLKEEIQDS